MTDDPEEPSRPPDDGLAARIAAIGDVLATAEAMRRENAFDRVLPYLESQLARHGDRALLGEAELRRGRLDAAVEHLAAALTAHPDDVPRRHLLGTALRRLNRNDEAIAAFEAVLARDPRHVAARQALGSLLTLKPERLAEGIAQLEAAVAAATDAAEPSLHDAQAALAGACLLAGRWEAGAALTNAVIAAEPNHGYANFYQSLLRLTLGDLANGFRQYEARWLVPTVSVPANIPDIPEWTTQDLRGRRLRVLSDQGVGDVIQFARYLPLLVERGASVVLELSPALTRLLQSLTNPHPDRPIEIVAVGDPAPPADFFAPICSLPTRFGTRLETIPASVPYLHAEPAATARWRRRLDATGNGPRIGLCWSGNPQFPLAGYRHMPADALAPLAEVPALYCTVQPDLAAMPPLPRLVDCGAALDDFADTAALIAALDLVVTVDTAVAHLAGALGKPVWLLLSRIPDWRWMLERRDNPWYPTARLFRQSHDGDWSGVVARVVEALTRGGPGAAATGSG